MRPYLLEQEQQELDPTTSVKMCAGKQPLKQSIDQLDFPDAKSLHQTGHLDLHQLPWSLCAGQEAIIARSDIVICFVTTISNLEGEGRVEISYNGTWGTVRDESWDLTDAKVVCQQLCCGVVMSAPAESYFERGIGHIMLDEVQGMGDEVKSKSFSLGRFSSETIPVFTSSSSHMIMVFHSDDIVTKIGFYASYESLLQDEKDPDSGPTVWKYSIGSLLASAEPVPVLPASDNLVSISKSGPRFSRQNLTLQVDHIEAFEEAEGVELELGHILSRGMEVGVGIVFDAPNKEENPDLKGY
ncbi:hypothetical protein ACRRTK_010851 [Alexandromys fortis]